MGARRYVKGKTLPVMLQALDSLDWDEALKNLR